MVRWILIFAFLLVGCDDGPQLGPGDPAFVGPQRTEYYPTICVGPPLIYIRDFVVVPVVMEKRGDVQAFGMRVSYQTEKLIYAGALRGALLEEWLVFGTKENEPGKIRIGGFHLEPIPAGAKGVLFALVFKIVEPGYATFIAGQFVDDIEEATTCVTVIDNP